MFGSWTDANGNKQTFFNGRSGDNICACGQTTPNECYQNPHLNENKCNCDARDPVLRSDTGKIKNKVPIIQRTFCLALSFNLFMCL